MEQIYNRERLAETFCRLVSIDSESFEERRMADHLKICLTELGFEVWEDRAGALCQSNAGNLYGFLKGELPGEPLLFSAHMDTVKPGIGKKAILQKDGRIVSQGDTVLGADDVAGIAAILEAVQSLREQHIPYRDIEVLFPVAEEAYVQGSSVFDYSRVKAKEAYVLDLEAPIGTASLQEPTLISFQIRLTGKTAHAGFAPEKGVNAIAMAAELITRIPQGRLGEDTTVNIGTIHGGTATNIVSGEVTLEGEIRSYCHTTALEKLEEIRQQTEAVARERGGEAAVTDRMHLTAYRVAADEPVVRRYQEACRKLGIKSALTQTFGGSDNNSFLQHGIRGIVLACGMHKVHTTEEYTTIEELTQSTAILMALMQTSDE
jgi:tripeptide aminopeptidase